MIRAIAIDDEPLALDVLNAMAARLDYLKLERVFSRQEEALRYLRKFDVDLLFLDIQMPRRDGFGFYEKVDAAAKVIFTTAFAEYALEGFNIQATDYLLKPFSFERFSQAVGRAHEQILLERKSPKINTQLSIRADYKLYNIEHENINFLESFDDYVKIHLEEGKTVTARATLKNLEKKLPSTFIRVHRSFIIPKKNIRKIEQQQILLDNLRIPIGSKYKAEVYQLFQK